MRIACVLETGFEDSEFKKPYDAFKRAGHQVSIIGTQSNKELKGDKGTVTTKTDAAIDSATPDQYDALFIPGGFSPDRLRVNPKVVSFTKAFFEQGKPVFAICHGPQLLLTARVLPGRKLTAWTTIQDDLKQVGGMTVVDEQVVVDGNLVTSRKPDDLEAFIKESLSLLQKTPVGARS